MLEKLSSTPWEKRSVSPDPRAAALSGRLAPFLPLPPPSTRLPRRLGLFLFMVPSLPPSAPHQHASRPVLCYCLPTNQAAMLLKMG